MQQPSWTLTIFFLFIGGILGYLGNIYANRKNNIELIALLKKEQLLIQARLEGSRLSQEETNSLISRQVQIQEQIDSINRRNLNLLQ